MASPQILPDTLLAVGHQTRLGMLGEQLAIEALSSAGFKSVHDLNKVRFNNVFADVSAERNGILHIVSVKTRNRLTAEGPLNSSYNLLKVAADKGRKLRLLGFSVNDITVKLYEELDRIAAREAAVPAWVTVPIDTVTGTFSAYFGLVSDLRGKRSIPMTPRACARYEVLAANLYDARITPDLSNTRPLISN